MLIIEGPDGAGKTTLIEYLEQRLGVVREPRAVSSDAVPLKSMGQYVTDELNRGFGRRIYDRFALISSPFYCMLPEPTFREQLLDREWLYEAWLKFRRVGPIVILCLPPIEEVRKNVLADETSRVMWNHIDTIYWLYHNFSCQYPFISHVWDYTQSEHEDLNALLTNFEDRLRHLQQKQMTNQLESKGWR